MSCCMMVSMSDAGDRFAGEGDVCVSASVDVDADVDVDVDVSVAADVCVTVALCVCGGGGTRRTPREMARGDATGGADERSPECDVLRVHEHTSHHITYACTCIHVHIPTHHNARTCTRTCASHHIPSHHITSHFGMRIHAHDTQLMDANAHVRHHTCTCNLPILFCRMCCDDGITRL